MNFTNSLWCVCWYLTSFPAWFPFCCYNKITGTEWVINKWSLFRMEGLRTLWWQGHSHMAEGQIASRHTWKIQTRDGLALWQPTLVAANPVLREQELVYVFCVSIVLNLPIPTPLHDKDIPWHRFPRDLSCPASKQNCYHIYFSSTLEPFSSPEEEWRGTVNHSVVVEVHYSALESWLGPYACFRASPTLSLITVYFLSTSWKPLSGHCSLWGKPTVLPRSTFKILVWRQQKMQSSKATVGMNMDGKLGPECPLWITEL